MENKYYCRRGETTDAIGRLKLGPMDARGFGEGLRADERARINKRTQGFTLLWGSRER